MDRPYPEDGRERDRWVVEHRPPRSTADRRVPAAWFLEEEPTETGERAALLTVLLTNRECPWRCVYCDLWRQTLGTRVQPGDIPAQLDLALIDPAIAVARPSQLKLYNAGSYFDAGAIPPEDDAVVGQRAGTFERLIVESHPRLVGDRCWRLRDRLREGTRGRGTALEVAMGLETVHEDVLRRLNKGVELKHFDRAAAALKREGVALRAFVLVQPPFQEPEAAVAWAVRSVRHALDVGARVVSLIPVRGGNGALEALGKAGLFRRPSLATFEQAVDDAMAIGRGLILADTWDLELFSECAACFVARRERLVRMNREQRGLPRVSCPVCGTGATGC